MEFAAPVTERSGLEFLRLIDANANRAREGIRTAEDYCRFSLNEWRWSGRLKSIRRDVSQILGVHFRGDELTDRRDVQQDPLHPQHDVATAHVRLSESPCDVAHRGLKRAQEALRVLEEFLRAPYPSSSAQLAGHRYLLYEAEQWLLGPGQVAAVVNAATVYVLLTSALCKQGLLSTAESVLKGGARLLQLREKGTAADNTLIARARDLLHMCTDYGAVLICNDRVDLALAAGMRGVHLGQNDLSIADARKISGERLFLGRSTHSVEQARAAAEVDQADYIAIGSIYETSTKQGRILAGIQLAEQVSALELPVPVFAIGGITREKVGELKAAGVRRIAVSTALIAQDDPESATKKLIEAMAV